MCIIGGYGNESMNVVLESDDYMLLQSLLIMFLDEPYSKFPSKKGRKSFVHELWCSLVVH